MKLLNYFERIRKMPNKANKFDIRLQTVKHTIVYGIKPTAGVFNTKPKRRENGYIPYKLCLNVFIARRRGIGTVVAYTPFIFNFTFRPPNSLNPFSDSFCRDRCC